MSQASEIPISITNADALSISNKATSRQLLGEIEVRSKEQPRMSLGIYTSTNPPKGFAICINPDPEPDAIVAQVTSLGAGDGYELILHIANYGNKTVSAEIWQL